MTLENEESSIVNNLAEFEKLSVKSISPTLEDYLKSISKSGDTCYNWSLVKPLLVYKLQRVLENFMDMVTENGDVSAPSPAEFQATKDRLSGLLEGFYRAPFTVQRLLELLLEPNKHYKKFDKYSRGLEKVLSVVTTVDPFPKKEPTSLLPNTILNGNGLMRSVDDLNKKKTVCNGELDSTQDDCKKRSTFDEERSPKRQKTQDLDNLTIVGDLVEADAAAAAAVSPDDGEVEPPVMAVSPDSTTNEATDEDESAFVKAISCVAQNTNREDEVTTTQDEGKEALPQTSLSFILSDHPSGSEG